MTSIDVYLANIESSKRKQLERIRAIAKKVVPQATETISYGMPTLQYIGKSFLGFNAHKNHLGIYPFGGEEIKMFQKEIASLGFTSSKGAIQVPYANPMPEDVLKEIIIHRIQRIEGEK